MNIATETISLRENQLFCQFLENLEEKFSVLLYNSIRILKATQSFTRNSFLTEDYPPFIDCLFNMFEKIITEVFRNNLLKSQITFDINYDQTKIKTIIGKTFEILRKNEYALAVLSEFIKHGRTFPFRIGSMINFARLFKAEEDLEASSLKLADIRRKCSFKIFKIVTGFALCYLKWLRLYKKNKKYRAKIKKK